jgi:hypothetical protein
MSQREIAKVLPQWIAVDVAHVDGSAAKNRRAAGANPLTDRDTVDGLVVRHREARRGPMTQMPAIFAQEQNRGQHVLVGLSLDCTEQIFKNLSERDSGGNLAEGMPLAFDQHPRPVCTIRTPEGQSGFRHVHESRS